MGRNPGRAPSSLVPLRCKHLGRFSACGLLFGGQAYPQRLKPHPRQLDAARLKSCPSLKSAWAGNRDSANRRAGNPSSITHCRRPRSDVRRLSFHLKIEAKKPRTFSMTPFRGGSAIVRTGAGVAVRDMGTLPVPTSGADAGMSVARKTNGASICTCLALGEGAGRSATSGGALVTVACDEDVSCADILAPDCEGGTGFDSSPGWARCTAAGRSFSETVGAGKAARITGTCGGGQPQSSGTEVSI